MELGVITPPISGFETVGFLSPPYFGVTGFQNPAPLIRRSSAAEVRRSIPGQQQPAASDRRQSRRDRTSAAVKHPECSGIRRISRRQRNNRLNFNFQHQLPGQIVGSVTYFMNFGDQHYTRALNDDRSADPPRRSRTR